MPGPIPNRQKSLCMTQGGRLNLWARCFNASLHLPRDEKDVYQAFLNRTLRYGNRLEEISEGDFLNGVTRRGRLISPPVEVTATRLREVIEILQAKKAFSVTVIDRSRYYYLNPDWSESVIEAIPLQPWDTDSAAMQALVEEDDEDE